MTIYLQVTSLFVFGSIYILERQFATGLVCYTCSNANTNSACTTTSNCAANEHCQNEIRDENGLHFINKMCKQDSACANDENGNPSTCHPAISPSRCYYCCNTNNCNDQEIPGSGGAPTTTQVAPTNAPTTVAPQSGCGITSSPGKKSGYFNLVVSGYVSPAADIIQTMTGADMSPMKCAKQCLQNTVTCASFSFSEIDNTCHLSSVTVDSTAGLDTAANFRIYSHPSQC